MPKKKSPISVYDATLMAWNASPDIVHMVIFFMDVRILTLRPALPDGTVSRKLRQLRLDGKLNYTVISNELSIYKKQPINK